MTSIIIQPVLMSGGSGLRLWPLSRQERPKQFAPLTGARSLFQETVLRVANSGRDDDGARLDFLPPIIVASAAHGPLIREQLAGIGVRDARLVLEPMGRDTAPCAAAAALLAAADAPDRLTVLLPCDHMVTDNAAFRAALCVGAGPAADGRIVTLGAAPAGPETAYGYIKAGAGLAANGGGAVFDVAAFHEKPDRARAESYLREGGFHWNAGIFLFRADALLEAFARHAPDILKSVRAALDGASHDGQGACLLDASAFSACTAQPLDRAIMERTDRAVVVPIDMGWSDVGQWAAVWDLAERDDCGMAIAGDVTAVDSRDCLVHSDGPPVMLAGVRDLVVVVKDGVVLVSRRGAADSVKSLTHTLRQNGRDELL